MLLNDYILSCQSLFTKTFCILQYCPPFWLINTVNSRFKKDLKLQIHLHKAFFLEDLFLDSLQKSFLNQTTLDLRMEKWSFLNREFTVIENIATF